LGAVMHTRCRVAAVLLAACVLLDQAPRSPGECFDAASSTTCELYLKKNAWECNKTIAPGTRVGDVCQRACYRPPCTNLTWGNRHCFDSSHTFSSCCNMSMSVGGDTSCWTGGRSFETCCLNLDPCRGYTCGPYGTCALSADKYTARCQCNVGYASSSSDGDHWCDMWGGNASCWSGQARETGIARSYNYCCNATLNASEGNAACWAGLNNMSFTTCQCADPRCRADRLSDCPAGQKCLSAGGGSGACTCASNYSGSSCSWVGPGSDPCSGVDCSSHGRCIAGTCVCDAGYISSGDKFCNDYIGNSACWIAGGAPRSAWKRIYEV
jgi:hypothetical protein